MLSHSLYLEITTTEISNLSLKAPPPPGSQDLMPKTRTLLFLNAADSLTNYIGLLCLLSKEVSIDFSSHHVNNPPSPFADHTILKHLSVPLMPQMKLVRKTYPLPCQSSI